jgi:uncharacterized membrane protein YhaH (DUF805 family)
MFKSLMTTYTCYYLQALFLPDMAVQVRRLIQIGDPSALQLRQLVAVHIAALGAGTVPLTAPVTLQHGVALQLVTVQAAVLHLKRGRGYTVHWRMGSPSSL